MRAEFDLTIYFLQSRHGHSSLYNLQRQRCMFYDDEEEEREKEEKKRISVKSLK